MKIRPDLPLAIPPESLGFFIGGVVALIAKSKGHSFGGTLMLTVCAIYTELDNKMRTQIGPV